MFRTVAWWKDDPRGAEIAEVELGGDRLQARGVAIGSLPSPYRLDYVLGTGARYITERLDLEARGAGWSRRLGLIRHESGDWTHEAESVGAAELGPAGGETADVRDVDDVDLGLSPLFNTMPLLRMLPQRVGAATDFLMLWISVPDLGLHLSPQRYTLRAARPDGGYQVGFEALSPSDSFTADIVFDRDGLVLDYPGIGHQVAPGVIGTA